MTAPTMEVVSGPNLLSFIPPDNSLPAIRPSEHKIEFTGKDGKYSCSIKIGEGSVPDPDEILRQVGKSYPGAKTTAVVTAIVASGNGLSVDVMTRIRMPAIREMSGCMRASSGSIILINPKNGLLEIETSTGLPAGSDTLKLKPGEGITGWVARTGKPACVGDVRQDSRYIMGKDLVENYPSAKAWFNQAEQILGFDIAKICFEGPEAELTKTEYCQPAIFLVSWIALQLLKERIPNLAVQGATAGLSLGELTALTAAGAFTFEDGLKTARQRGRFMRFCSTHHFNKTGKLCPGE